MRNLIIGIILGSILSSIITRYVYIKFILPNEMKEAKE